jgi:putative cell wall-binding protein
VDGEISVTQVGADDRGVLKSFRRDGTPVTYATTSGAREHVWGPAGDVVAARVAGTDPTFTRTELNSPKEYLKLTTTSTPRQWSPFGDSLVGPGATGSNGQQVATWTGSGRSELLTTGTAKDTGAATPIADGLGALLTVPSPTVSGKRDLALVQADFPRYGNVALHAPAGAPQPLGYGDLDARLPATSADGTLAFVGTGDKGAALFVDEGQGPVAVRSLGADCAGQRPAFAPSGRAIAVLVATPDCSSTELHVVDQVNGSFVGGTDTLVTTSTPGSHFEWASWRALTPAAHTERLGGRDRIATAITTSNWGWPEGSEGAVLASSASFADAVVAGPLSAQSGMPLLLNGAATLDSRVLTELKRLMRDPADRFVAIVGGTGVIGSGVEKALRANGFTVQRVAGRDRFGTSVAVARELDAGWQGLPVPRSSAFLADGMNFPDALSAGPAASVFFAPVLLTKGKAVPPSVASYVNGRGAIKDVYGIGGNAAAASRSFTAERTVQVFGQDRYETSTKVAQAFFPGGSYVGYASGQSFPDALAGGALMGAMAEPLLLVSGTAVPSVVRTQADRYRAGTDLVLLFGGTGVVSDAVRTTVSGLAGRQTAIWGWTTPTEANPDYEEILAGRGTGTHAPVGGHRAGNSRPQDATAGGFRSATER